MDDADPPRLPSRSPSPRALPPELLRSPLFLMLLLLREGRRSAEAAKEGPQLGRFSVLACLVGLGSLSQADVARRVGFDPSDLVTVIDALERDGLVERRRDPADRRRYALTATPAGLRWFAERSDKGAARARAFFAALDDEEYAVLQELLRRTLAHHAGH